MLGTLEAPNNTGTNFRALICIPTSALFVSGLHGNCLQGLSGPSGISRYNRVMLWFFNRTAGPLRFIGIHCDKRPDDYKLVVLYPDCLLYTSPSPRD